MSSTAANGHHHFAGYDVQSCDFTPDGRRLFWPGQNAAIEPTIDTGHSGPTRRGRVVGTFADWSYDLELSVTNRASWVVTTPVYQHFSILARARGVIDAGLPTEVVVDSDCGFEFARGFFHQALTRRLIPEGLKLPADFFAYQIVNLESAQLTLGGIMAALGITFRRSASLRTRDKSVVFFTEDQVSFTVDKYFDEAGLDTEGKPMRLPEEFTWEIRSAEHRITVHGRVDGPFRLGHGRGFVAPYTHTTDWNGERQSGTAYLEWVDVG